MNMEARIGGEEERRIIARFGQPFYDRLGQVLDTYAKRWSLSAYELIPSYSANLVFTCRSAQYGDAILKIGGSGPRELRSEAEALQFYRGGRFCRLYEADYDGLVLLEERLVPGTPLRGEQSLARRLDVFCSLYRDLHLAAGEAGDFAAYTSWVENIAADMRERHDGSRMNAHMQRAWGIYRELAAVYSDRKLLHGDFHHDNILLGAEGSYRIIDPKGVIGDPIFDTPRFILNEFDDGTDAATRERIETSIEVLSERLGLPQDVIRQCLYVETAMGLCWQVQDGEPVDAPDLVRFADFAESFLPAE